MVGLLTEIEQTNPLSPSQHPAEEFRGGCVNNGPQEPLFPKQTGEDTIFQFSELNKFLHLNSNLVVMGCGEPKSIT